MILNDCHLLSNNILHWIFPWWQASIMLSRKNIMIFLSITALVINHLVTLNFLLWRDCMICTEWSMTTTRVCRSCGMQWPFSCVANVGYRWTLTVNQDWCLNVSDSSRAKIHDRARRTGRPMMGYITGEKERDKVHFTVKQLWEQLSNFPKQMNSLIGLAHFLLWKSSFTCWTFSFLS